MEGLERRQLQGSHEACGQTTLRTLEMKNKEGCSGNDCLRRYMLSLPSITCQGHHAQKVYPFTLPVMFSVHCFGCSLSTLEYMSAIASEYNFIWVNPEGLHNSFNADACCGYAMEKGINDVGFFEEIIETLVQEFPTLVSSDWVYAMGWSNGGYMVSNAARLFRGIAPVSGYEIESLSVERPTVIFLNHALDDHFVQPTGCCTDPTMPRCCCGLSDVRYDQCTSVEGQMHRWATINGCNKQQDPRTVYHASINATCHYFDDCQANTTYCLHGGHKGHFNQEGFERAFPWSHEIVDFFASHMCLEQDRGSDDTGRAVWEASSKVCHCPGSHGRDLSLPNRDEYVGPYCTRIAVRSSLPEPLVYRDVDAKSSSPMEWNHFWMIVMILTVAIVMLLTVVGRWTRSLRRPSQAFYSYTRVPQSSRTTGLEMGTRMR